MIRSRLFRCILAVLLVCTIMLSVPVMEGHAETNTNNRFNVVIVLDASGSMLNTDPQGHRYEAISQFTGLLAEQGNVLGGVVFHNGVEAEQVPTLITDQAGKNAVVEMLGEVPSTGGWTNTGAGLARAVEMLKTNGDPNLPSVILFLSDGNTDMPTAEQEQASLDQKADALQEAREAGIVIYSVCLNANRAADVSEMQQISDATGGVFQEVTKAEDLQRVFNSFYDLIYGTSTITLVDEVFPDSGVLETTFDVPGLGVEEVNIIIYGNTTKKSLRRPDGSESTATSIDGSTFSMLKLTEVTPGTWTLVTEGVPGDSIKINMVYNTDLEIETAIDPASLVINPADPVTITATLKGDNILATSGNQYIGYAAELQVMNAYGEYLESIPMSITGEHFEVKRNFAEGIYYYKVIVSGNHIEKESEQFGPLTSTTKELTEAQKNNTPPTPVKEVIEENIKLWPLTGGSYTLDMNTLATDAQDSTLRYKIVSSSFVDGTDYTVDSNGVLHLEHFSLSKGAFTIRATDSGGLSCDVEVIVETTNIGLMTLIGIVVIGLIVAIVCCIIVLTAAKKPWHGRLTVRNLLNNAPNTRGDFRGNLPLKKLSIGNCGVDGKFVPLGRNRLEFVSKKDVYPERNGMMGTKTKRVSIMEGTVTIYANENKQGGIAIDAKPEVRASFSGFGGGGSSHYGKKKPSKSPRPSSASNPFA